MREDDAGRAGTTSAVPAPPAGAEAALLEAALPPCYTPQQVRFTDRRGTLTRVSPSASAIIGYHPDEMIGRSGVDFVHPDDLDSTRTELRRARRGHEMRTFETR